MEILFSDNSKETKLRFKKKRYKNKKLLQEKSNFSEKVPTKISNYKKTIKLFLKIADNPFKY